MNEEKLCKTGILRLFLYAQKIRFLISSILRFPTLSFFNHSILFVVYFFAHTLIFILSLNTITISL